jgi:predicted Zn finger-like uncharacterized protein
VIVACPSCQTRFQLDPAKLQPVGRHVRCAKCAHRWLQLPEGMEVPPGLMPPEEPEAPPAATPPAPTPEPAPAAPPAAVEPAASESAPAETAIAEPAAAEAPAKPPETPAEVAESLAAIAEQVAAAGQGQAGQGQAGQGQAGQGQAGQAGAAAEKPAEAGGPARRLSMRMTGPIVVPPQMKPAKAARRSSGLGLLIVIGIIIGVLLGAMYIFRDAISRMVPGADMLYSLLHISTNSPAADLEISIESTDAQDRDGKTFFSVTATIFNLSEYPVDVPPLVIVPMDENNNAMEPIQFRLRERVAQPGQNIKFQKSFDNWPTAAKSFQLSVAGAE